MILLVNQHTVPIFADIANAFAASGEKITLFASYIEKGGKPLSPKIRIVHSIKYNRKNAATRLFSWSVFSLHYFFFLLFGKKPSAVLVVTNPPLAPLVTALAARLRKFSYYIIVYDLYPEALAMSGLVKKSGLVYRCWEKINPSVFRKAKGIFTLSQSMQLALAKYVGDISKVKVIYNWADISYIQPIPKNKNSFIDRYALNGKKVILYAGNMGLTHDLESLVEAAALLKDRSDIVFIFIGEGGKKELLRKSVISKALKNVLFLPYQDAENFPLAMAAADIGVVTLGAGAEGISVPSKTYVNLAAGLCILAISPKASELSRLVEQYDAGVTCEPGDYLRISERLSSLIRDENKIESYKVNALAASKLFTSQNAQLYVNEVLYR